MIKAIQWHALAFFVMVSVAIPLILTGIAYALAVLATWLFGGGY
jgi:hypothetical protein